MKKYFLLLTFLFIGCTDKYIGYERHKMAVLDVFFDAPTENAKYYYLHVESTTNPELKIYFINLKCDSTFRLKPGDALYLTVQVYENKKTKNRTFQVGSMKEIIRYCN